MIHLKFKNTPPSTQHIYRHAGHRVYMTKDGSNAKEAYQWEIKSQYKDKPILAPISVIIELHFKDKIKRDIDNFNKLLLDAGSGMIWKDDSQIHELVIRKFVDNKVGVDMFVMI